MILAGDHEFREMIEHVFVERGYVRNVGSLFWPSRAAGLSLVIM